MARTRLVSPKFFTDRRVLLLQPLERLLFQGLWCMADKEGRLADEPFELKLLIMPVDVIDIDEALSRMVDAGLIQRYAAGGVRVVQIRNFLKYQKPHAREQPSALPVPEKAVDVPEKAVDAIAKAVASPAVSVSVSVPVSKSVEVSPPPRSTIRDPPFVVDPPKTPPEAWNGDEWWRWAQHRRQEAGFQPEQPPNTRELSTWLTGAHQRTGGDVHAIQEAFYRWGDDEYWQKKTPPLPWIGFASQYWKYLPKRLKNAAS